MLQLRTSYQQKCMDTQVTQFWIKTKKSNVDGRVAVVGEEVRVRDFLVALAFQVPLFDVVTQIHEIALQSEVGFREAILPRNEIVLAKFYYSCLFQGWGAKIRVLWRCVTGRFSLDFRSKWLRCGFAKKCCMAGHCVSLITCF